MPFGRKVDPKTSVEVDFDQVYEQGIKPAIEAAGLECIRGDQDETGGIIHTAMFARLLMAEYVVADMTSANPNVFYELGVRHAARPYTTIALFATLGQPPFDVGMVRAIPYELHEGKLTPEGAAALKTAILARIEAAKKSPVAQDSPLFQLFNNFPGIDMNPALTDVFRDRVAYSQAFKAELAKARALKPAAAALAALQSIEAGLGDISTAERGVVIDLLLSLRDVKGFDAMVALVGRMSGEVKQAPITQQQLAFALNRRKQAGDVDHAIQILEALRVSHGDSGETSGLLGRIYKDRYDAEPAGSLAADGWLDLAIEAYTQGFETEPLDPYPGINALTLLLLKDDEEAKQAFQRLLPLVTFANQRRGAEKSSDYWTAATALELACLNRDEKWARRCLPRVLVLAGSGAGTRWMLESTAANLNKIASRWKDVPQAAFVQAMTDSLLA